MVRVYGGGGVLSECLHTEATLKVFLAIIFSRHQGSCNQLHALHAAFCFTTLAFLLIPTLTHSYMPCMCSSLTILVSSTSSTSSDSIVAMTKLK